MVVPPQLMSGASVHPQRSSSLRTPPLVSALYLTSLQQQSDQPCHTKTSLYCTLDDILLSASRNI